MGILQIMGVYFLIGGAYGLCNINEFKDIHAKEDLGLAPWSQQEVVALSGILCMFAWPFFVLSDLIDLFKK